ncbi:MAG TPA: hypothetical protein VGQ92_30420 [Actinoplanes sp.]|jgi:hypothetical protein|nr:hypothetical protein [Actinoplanes sp.]
MTVLLTPLVNVGGLSDAMATVSHAAGVALGSGGAGIRHSLLWARADRG